MQTALVCLCLLSTALSTPVPLPLPGRAAGNCVGQHRILLKGCNAKHGFYFFNYILSFSTRRNQTQIKKEEADGQSAVPRQGPGEDGARRGPTEGAASPEPGNDGSTHAVQSGAGPKPGNRSAAGAGGHSRAPRPGTRAHGAGTARPGPASAEGSGDPDLAVDTSDAVPFLPQGRRPSEAKAGSGPGVGRGDRDRDRGAPLGVPVQRAVTTVRERAHSTGTGDEGSGEPTVPGQGREGITQGTGTGGTNLTSITEQVEDIQVDTKGVDEYAYMPDSGSITVTHGKVGSTSFTQISPDKDNEVNIFIGSANIRMGEQETTQASATVDGEDDGIGTVGTSSPPPRLGNTMAREGDDNDGIPAHRQPEGPATTVTVSYGDSITHSPGDSRPTGEDENGATTVSEGKGLVAPGSWRVAGGDVTVPVGTGNQGSGEKVNSEGQRLEGQLDHLAVTTPGQRRGKQAAATIPAEGASIRWGTTTASPGVSQGDCTTALGTRGTRKAGGSPAAGTAGSGEARPATPQPPREGRPGARARVRPGGAGLDEAPGVDTTSSPHGKAGTRAAGRGQSRAQTRVGGHGSGAGSRPRATEARGTPRAQAGPTGGSMAAGEGRERGQGGSARAGSGHPPRRHGGRPEARAPGTFAALGHSRRVDHVRRADELHVRERAFYTLSGAGGGPRGPHTSLGSADSSQSSEGERGSRSDSRQAGLRDAGWGAPGHPHGRWNQGPL